jgi:hypothetical protein
VLLQLYWLIDYDGVRLTSQNCSHHWPIVHPPGECEWRAVVMMMPAGENSLVYQSLLVVLPAEISGASSRSGRRNENLRIQYLWYVKGSSTCRKILRHGTSGFTSNLKEGVLWIFITLKNPSPHPGLNPRPLGPVASTLTTIPPRRLIAVHLCEIFGLILGVRRTWSLYLLYIIWNHIVFIVMRMFFLFSFFNRLKAEWKLYVPPGLPVSNSTFYIYGSCMILIVNSDRFLRRH